jgi:hypothetical protein
MMGSRDLDPLAYSLSGPAGMPNIAVSPVAFDNHFYSFSPSIHLDFLEENSRYMLISVRFVFSMWQFDHFPSLFFLDTFDSHV